MQKKGNNSKPSTDKNERKRGRPTGKNRVPLSLAERRARNAQYERERRYETADAMVQLAEAACCDPQITNPELLATVINRLHQKEKSSKSIEDLKRSNENLESQIADLLCRLESGPNFEEKHVNVKSEEQTTSSSDGRTTSYSDGRITSHSNSNSDSKSSENLRPTKYRKTSKRGTVHDNARLSSSSRHPESSTDTQDSDWSNHHLGKTLPTLPLQFQPTSINELNHDKSLKDSDSVSSECKKSNSIQCLLNFEDDFYSESSDQSEAFSVTSSQQDVNVEIQLLPELSQIKPESFEEQIKMSFVDPFTDGEKAMLEKLGWSDFINFQGSYSENPANLIWPVDYPGYF